MTCAPEIFYAEDTDGDGKADVRIPLFTGFMEGNPQHRLNSLIWGLDNWFHGANGDSGGNIPMGRVGQMSELANLAVFLMADGCDYLTGQTIAIDGAMHLASGGNFAALSKLGDADWERIKSEIRSANEKDKTKRAV